MKAYCSIVLLLALFFQAPEYKNEINTEIFLLGFMKDFEGCFYEKKLDKKEFIIIVHNDYTTRIKTIEDLTGFKFKNNRKKKKCDNCHDFSHLNIKNKDWKIAKYYEFEKEKIKTTRPSTKYCGKFRVDIVKSWDLATKISYLEGVHLRSTEKDEEGIKIKLYNSPSKYKLIDELMQELGFELKKSSITATIPMTYYLEFKNNDEYWNKYFKEI